MTVGVPCQPGQREPFEEAVEHVRAHRAERIPIQAHSPTRTPRPSQQRHRPDKLQGQAKGEIRQHLHRWKLGPMLVTARFVRTVEHERIKMRYLEMTKSEKIDELKTRIRARASDRARLAQSIIERILAVPTTTVPSRFFRKLIKPSSAPSSSSPPPFPSARPSPPVWTCPGTSSCPTRAPLYTSASPSPA